MTGPSPKPSLEKLKAYQPGKSKIEGVEKTFKLSSNEAAMGPSPKALEAFAELGDTLPIYPDGHSTLLRETIADVHGLDPARVICGNGSDEVLSMLADAYLQPGDEAIYSRHGFTYYNILIQASGATPVLAPEPNLVTDVDSILSSVTDKTRLIYIANPNNPTGTYLDKKEIKRLHSNLPDHILLVLDGAYAEFVTRGDYESGLTLAKACNNVAATRTFSKIYGLAQLRVGWGYMPAHIADVINRIRPPFNVNGIAQKVAAAAIRDVPFIAQCVVFNETWREYLTEEISSLGLEVTPSIANFILIHFPDEPGKSAADADLFLQKRGLILRRLEAYYLPHCLRLTVGTEEANKRVVQALSEFVNGS